MNKLAKFAVLPALVLGGVFLGSSAFATATEPVSTGEPSLAEQLDEVFATENPSGVFDIDITAREKDVTCDISQAFTGPTDDCTPVGDEVLEILEGIIDEAGITIGDNLSLGTYLDQGYSNYGIYRWMFVIWDTESNADSSLVYSKPIRTKYSDTIPEGTEKQQSIKEDFDNAVAQQVYYFLPYGFEGTYSSYAKDWMPKMAEHLEKEIGEKYGDLDIYFEGIGAGGTPELAELGIRWVFSYYFYVFCDDMYLTYGTIMLNTGIGFHLDDGTQISVTEIFDWEDKWGEMKAELAKRGHSEVLNAAELHLFGEHDGLIDVVLTVGTEYNGKTMVILHKRDDGTYEEWQRNVVDGKVTIVTDSLSPFMVALKGANTPEIQDPVYGTTGGSTSGNTGGSAGTTGGNGGNGANDGATAPDTGIFTNSEAGSVAINTVAAVFGVAIMVACVTFAKKFAAKKQA